MTRFKFLSAASAALLLAACSGGSPSELQPGTLVTVGPHFLTKAEVDSHMPAGLSAADSTAMARAYIRSWIEKTIFIIRIFHGPHRLSAKYGVSHPL